VKKITGFGAGWQTTRLNGAALETKKCRAALSSMSESGTLPLAVAIYEIFSLRSTTFCRRKHADRPTYSKKNGVDTFGESAKFIVIWRNRLRDQE
jgi:hypothetical protein